jgi:hypothetical protein
MKRIQLLALIATLFGAATTQAGPRVAIGIGIGAPVGPYYYRPWYPYYYYDPVYVAPAPVYVQPAPIVVTAPPPPVAPAPSCSAPACANADLAPPQPYGAARPATYEPTPPVVTVAATADTHLANLRSPDENIRRNSVLELGRMRAQQALDPLAATLAGDQSPVVREAAARALGLIGSPRALPALLHAAQADSDRDVRHSAQFAVDVVRTAPR